MEAKFPLTLEEALKRMVDSDPVEVMFQMKDVTLPATQPREHIVAILKAAAEHNFIEESGYFGQRMNYGIHVPGKHPVYGYGWLFVATKPECRVPDEVIQEREQERAEALAADAAVTFAQAQKIGQHPQNKEVN